MSMATRLPLSITKRRSGYCLETKLMAKRRAEHQQAGEALARESQTSFANDERFAGKYEPC